MDINKRPGQPPTISFGSMFGLAGVLLCVTSSQARNSHASSDASSAPAGWSVAAARDEIRPTARYEAASGPDGKGCFILAAASQEGLDGCWRKSFPISGGKYYHFEAFYRATGV